MSDDWDDPTEPAAEPPKETRRDAARRSFRKLMSALENGDAVVFEPREAEVLRSWARFLLATQAIGSAANVLRQAVIWIGGAILAYAALKGYLHTWLDGIK